LLDRKLGHDAFLGVLKTAVQAAKTDPNGLTLASLREALAARGGVGLKSLMDAQLDQVVDTDLMVGLPVQRGAEWVSQLRNIGSIDVTVTVAATTDRGEQVLAEATVPAKDFGQAVFKTPAKIVRVEVDPEKFYPQLDYGNDVVPRAKDLPDALNEAQLQIGAQDYAKAGLPMLPVTHGPQYTRLQIVLYTFALVAVSMMPFAIRMSGLLYLVSAVALGGVFLGYAIRLYFRYSDDLARATFRYSIVYLAAIFSALLVDHYWK